MAKYVDGPLIGSGGFARVRHCTRAEDGNLFAKKILIDEDDQEAVGRFLAETRMLAKLDHPRIVQVVGVHLKTPPYWYVMPSYKTSLAAELPRIAGDLARIRTIFDEVLEGMQYAHEQGVIHRDIKPSNVLMNGDGDVVVSDFGLGRILEADGARLTVTGDPLGTYGYVAPEQLADAKKADERSDVFSLGRMLYVLLTGEHPLSVQDVSKTPPEMAMIINRCTDGDPAKRFVNAAEMRLAFNSVFKAIDRASDEGRLRGLIADATTWGVLDSDEMDELVHCLSSLSDDPDLMHETCVNLPQQVVGEIWTREPYLTAKVLSLFAEQISGQGWPFNYVDTLGRTCWNILAVVDDPNLRATLIGALADVSVGHNRWVVMDTTARAIETYNSPAEDSAIAKAFESRPNELYELKSRIGVRKVGPCVASLLGPDE